MLNARKSNGRTQGTLSPRVLFWWPERTREPLAAFRCPAHRVAIGLNKKRACYAVVLSEGGSHLAHCNHILNRSPLPNRPSAPSERHRPEGRGRLRKAKEAFRPHPGIPRRRVGKTLKNQQNQTEIRPLRTKKFPQADSHAGGSKSEILILLDFPIQSYSKVARNNIFLFCGRGTARRPLDAGAGFGMVAVREDLCGQNPAEIHLEQGNSSQKVSVTTVEIDNSAGLRHPAPMSKSALGRGLGALLGGGSMTSPAPIPAIVQPVTPAPAAADSRDRVQKVPLDKIRPSALQPRKQFSEESLRELADSIREQGIVQPLIVRPRGDLFELIAGERRWRAAQLLHLPEVPVIEREADDRTVLELALIENLQRENLNPIEEALGYSQLAGQFQMTQEEISSKVGKSRAVVANALRLLKLPQAIQDFIRQGQISVGHAKVILGLADETSQKLAADRIIKEALNVRQTEGLVAKLQSSGEKEPANKIKVLATPTGDPHVTDLESRLRELFATKVKLNYSQGKGSLEISFFSNEELERILQVLGVSQG